MRIGKAFFESGAEAKPADAEVTTEKVIDKTAAEGTQSGGEGSDDNLTGQGSANDGDGNADAGAANGEGEGGDGGNGDANPTEQTPANDGEGSNGGEDDTKPVGQDSTNEGEGGADAAATEEAPKKGKVGRPAKK